MFQGYTTLSGRVSRPPKAYGADRPVVSECPYQPYVPRRRRNRAESSQPGAGELNPGASGVDLQMPGSLRVVHSDDKGRERPVTPPWSKGYCPPREDTDNSDGTVERNLPEADKIAGEATHRGAPGRGTPSSQPKTSGKETPKKVPTVVKPVRRQHTTEGAATAGGAGSAAKETTVSLRSSLWQQEAVECLKEDQAERLKVQAGQAMWHVALSEQRSRMPSHRSPKPSIDLVDEWENSSLFKLVSTNEYGSPSDRYPNDEIPPIPKVLVPNTPESAGEMLRRQRGNRKALTARGLEAVRPMARQAPSTQRREIGLWNSFRSAMKPVNNWLAEVSEAIIQPTIEKSSAHRKHVVPGLPGSQAREGAVQRSNRDECELEEQLEKEYQELLAKRRELELRLALQKSAIEAKRSLEKQNKSEIVFEKSQEEAGARRRVDPSTSVDMVEHDQRSRTLRDRPSCRRAPGHLDETSRARSNPKTMELVTRATDSAKVPTKRLSDYSGSPLSNDESESTERRERRKSDRKQKRAAIKAIHLDKPRTYDGEVVYDEYESWMENFRYWRDLHDLQEHGTILAMSLVITGAAKEWYNLNVQGHETEWTLDKVSEDMFRDIFPENYDSILRETFEDACQGENSLKKWHKYLMKLSKRVKFVNKHEIRRRFWKGSATYLQMEWARIGLFPEDADTKVETMLQTGLRFERARGYELAEEKRMPFDYLYEEEALGVLRTRQPHRRIDLSNAWHDQQPEDEASDGGWQNEEENLTSEDPSDDEYLTSKTSSEEGSSTDEDEPTEDEDPREEEELTSEASSNEEALTSENSSDDEGDQMRTKRRCFQCGRRGHIARNCPQRREGTSLRKQNSETSSVYIGSLQFEGLFSTARRPIIHQDLMEVDDEGKEETSGSDSNEYKCKNDVEVPDPEGGSDPGSEGSSEGDDLPEEVMEPKWGRGRPRESVLPATTKPTKEPTSRESRVAPSASKESEMPSPMCGLASHKRSTYDSEAEGESDDEEPKAAKKSQYKSRDEPNAKSAIENSTMAQKGQSYTCNPEFHLMKKINGWDAPGDSQRLIECDPEGRDGENTFSAGVLEDPMQYTTAERVRSRRRERIHLNEWVPCLPNVVVGSRRAPGMIPTNAHSILAHPEARKSHRDEIGVFMRIIGMEEVSPAGDSGGGDDKREISDEGTTQKVIKSNSRISYSIYDIRSSCNSNVPRNPERVAEKHEETPTLTAPKTISAIEKSPYIAFPIGSAESTLEIAADTQKIIDNISPPTRRAIRHHVEITPWKGNQVIEIPNTTDRNERSPKMGTAKMPGSALTQSTTQPLVSLYFEPLNDTKTNRELLRELKGHQVAPSRSASTSKDPGRSQPATEDPDNARLREIGIKRRENPAITEGRNNATVKAEDCATDRPPYDAN